VTRLPAGCQAGGTVAYDTLVFSHDSRAGTRRAISEVDYLVCEKKAVRDRQRVSVTLAPLKLQVVATGKQDQDPRTRTRTRRMQVQVHVGLGSTEMAKRDKDSHWHT